MDNHYGGVIWTNHALQRLAERGIKQGDAWATFSNPQSSQYAKTKGAWVFYRTYGVEKIEVVASQNKNKEWIILSVWSSSSSDETHRQYRTQSFLENIIEKILQALFGKLRNNISKKH